jgi:hypothetical protein
MRDAETVLGIIQDRGKHATRTFTPDAWTDATIEEGSDWKAG